MVFQRTGKLAGAIILIVLGALFMLENFGYLQEDVWKFWPLVLVVIGLVLLFEYFFDKPTKKSATDWL